MAKCEEVTIDCPFGEDDDCPFTLTIELQEPPNWNIVDGEHEHVYKMSAAREKVITEILNDRAVVAYEDDVDRRIDQMREREPYDRDWIGKGDY